MPLGLNDLLGVFLIFGVGVGMATLTFPVEKIITRYQQMMTTNNSNF